MPSYYGDSGGVHRTGYINPPYNIPPDENIYAEIPDVAPVMFPPYQAQGSNYINQHNYFNNVLTSQQGANPVIHNTDFQNYLQTNRQNVEGVSNFVDINNSINTESYDYAAYELPPQDVERI